MIQIAPHPNFKPLIQQNRFNTTTRLKPLYLKSLKNRSKCYSIFLENTLLMVKEISLMKFITFLILINTSTPFYDLAKCLRRNEARLGKFWRFYRS